MTKVTDKELLLKIGVKDALLDKLDSKVIKDLAIYAIDHYSNENLLNSIIQIASMEVRGKVGAAYLIAHSLATIVQLKNIVAETINEIYEDHKFHNDDAITIKLVKEALVMSQQEKLYTKTDGYKGEFFVDPKSDN
jgi:hypothetical protein